MTDEQNNALSPNHYSRFTIQPLDFISENGLDFLQGNIIKYVCRYDAKNGLEDLQKARVYLDKLIEKVDGKTPKREPAKNPVLAASYAPEQPSSKPGVKNWRKMLVVSNSNITEEDGEMLSRIAYKPDTDEGSHAVFRHDAGWLIDVRSLEESVNSAASKSLRSLLYMAVCHGADWLCLDRDAELIPGCEVYNW